MSLYGFLGYYINWLFVIILNCVCVRIIRKSFLISYFFINYFLLTFVVLKATKFFSF